MTWENYLPDDSPLLASYPWYFSDWRSSEARASMNSRERYLYRELLDHCWEKGSLPFENQNLAHLRESVYKNLKYRG